MATILVAEDESMIREMLIRWLTAQGFTVVSVQDGARAVAMARSAQPDLILLDIGLPILNGWQVTHRLKTASDTHAIPIIALTAYVLPEERSQSLSLGCVDFEPKPIDFERLLGKIRAHLRTHAVSNSSTN